MRLTNIIRDSFVRAAMQDVPKVDYDDQYRKAYAKAHIDAMPADLGKAYSKHPEWFHHEFKYPTGFGGSIRVVSPTHTSGAVCFDEETRSNLNRLLECIKEQRRNHNDLEDKIRAVAYSCTTRKALAATLPEFEKYLPADEPAACKTLPAVANLMADFTKAGWPKAKTQTIKGASA